MTQTDNYEELYTNFDSINIESFMPNLIKFIIEHESQFDLNDSNYTIYENNPYLAHHYLKTYKDRVSKQRNYKFALKLYCVLINKLVENKIPTDGYYLPLTFLEKLVQTFNEMNNCQHEIEIYYRMLLPFNDNDEIYEYLDELQKYGKLRMKMLTKRLKRSVKNNKQ